MHRGRSFTAASHGRWSSPSLFVHGVHPIVGGYGVSERTVRQQAQAVYHKGNLAGRAELAALFLEDLFVLRRSCAADKPPPIARAGRW